MWGFCLASMRGRAACTILIAAARADWFLLSRDK
jgi:hypothetical protein